MVDDSGRQVGDWSSLEPRSEMGKIASSLCRCTHHATCCKFLAMTVRFVLACIHSNRKHHLHVIASEQDNGSLCEQSLCECGNLRH